MFAQKFCIFPKEFFESTNYWWYHTHRIVLSRTQPQIYSLI
jgi:hypothetical protein